MERHLTHYKFSYFVSFFMDNSGIDNIIRGGGSEVNLTNRRYLLATLSCALLHTLNTRLRN